MKCLYIFTDLIETIAPLNDAEKGRLLTAMLAYAGRGAEPQLGGNERFIWPTVKLHIDRQAEAYSRKVSGAAKARARKPPLDGA